MPGKKISLLSTNLTLEGNVVFNLARELSREGFDVTLISPHAAGLKGSEQINGVRIKRFRYFFPTALEMLAQGSGIPQNLRRNPLLYLLIPFFMVSFSINAILAARKSELLHAHWLPAGIAALPAKYLFGKPIVLSVHGSDIRSMPKSIAMFFLKRFDAVITGHDELFETVESAAPNKAFLVRNLIDFGLAKKMKPKQEAKKELGIGNKKAVSFIGRLCEFKQPIKFIEAASLVIKKNDGVVFIIVGNGPLEKKARKRAKELGIANNTIFAGRVKNIFGYLSASDVFAAVSHIENAFSVSLIEALLAGVPCVLTKAGTTEKFFSNGKDCLLVGKESNEELAKAMLKLLENNSLSKKIGLNGKKTAEKLGFDRESIIKQTAAIYSKTMGKGF